MTDVEPPKDGSFNLCATFAANLVEVGMVPEVGNGSGESAVAIEQRWRVGDWSPSVTFEFSIEREVHADVFATEVRCCFASPCARHHQRCAGADTLPERLVGAGISGMTKSQVVAVDDDQFGIGGIAQTFGEGGHRFTVSPETALVLMRQVCPVLRRWPKARPGWPWPQSWLLVAHRHGRCLERWKGCRRSRRRRGRD